MKKELTAFDWGLCIGQKILYGGEIYKLIGLDHKFLFMNDSEWLLYPAAQKFCNPILRSLDQITEKEKEEFQIKFEYYKELCFHADGYSECKSGCHGWKDYTLEMYDWLTQKGIDMRGWLAAGLAIKYDEVEHGRLS